MNTRLFALWRLKWNRKVEAYTLELPLETNLLAFTLYARTVLDIPGEPPRR